jgi:NAD(P)-dependent dehydrogenase (short-subunit alcohol dehydrogenase family)
MLEVNLMASVRAARFLVPGWLADGHERDGVRGRFVVTASAAGLLTTIGAAPYAVSKRAVVAFAEWLSVTYGHHGVAVQAICPQGVQTQMLEQGGALTAALTLGETLTSQDVADAWVDAVVEDRFLVLPHHETAGYYARKATDPEGWLRGMRRLQTTVDARLSAQEGR